MEIEGDIATIRQNLGNRIRMLRKGLALSQESFSKKIEMNRSYLGSVESGKRNVSIDNLCKIARGLDISLSELFIEVDDPASIARRRELMGELLRKEQEKAEQNSNEEESDEQEPEENQAH